MLLRAGTILNDRYEILNTVGTGGMANVYRARDNVLKRLVAVKVLKEEYSSDAGFVAKFRREAQAAGGFSHPNIVSVYDVGDQGGMYYIVMEMVEGVTLKKYVEKVGKLSEREAVEVAMQVAKGLEAAHEQGIVHRDVKPQNIIISREGKIKVADFGIARVSATETIAATTMGSVHYISPEQARGGACDARSDVYSLGITLFEMVTGTVPYDGDSAVAVALKHVQDPMPTPTSLEPGISANLEKIILKCTQKNPAYRYGSMAALLLDFRKLILSPGEDFVVLPGAEDNNPSLRMSQEDADILKVAGISSAGRDWTDAEQALLALEEGAPRAAAMQEEDRLAEEKAKRTENILNYVMLGIALLILVMIIAIAFKACSLYNPGDSTTAAATTTRPSATYPSQSTPANQTTAPPVTSYGNTVVMPNFVGMTIEEAMTKADELGLVLNIEERKVQDVTSALVLDQNWDEGTVLNRGAEVTLWISVKEDTSTYVPTSIVGKTLAEATEILSAAGLIVSNNPEWKPSQVIDYGLVIDCSPSLGSTVEKNSSVTLILSSGPSTVRMPDILGMSEAQARAALKAAGISVDTYVHLRSTPLTNSSYDPETVGKIEATVNGQLMEVQPGASVDVRGHIYLSITENLVTLPNLVGRSDLDAVQKELEALGFTVSATDDETSTLPIGQISKVTQGDDDTLLKGGDKVPGGSGLRLHISARKVPADLVGKSVQEVVNILSAAGLGYHYVDDKAPADPEKAKVTAVNPISGSKLGEGQKIAISFSEPEMVTIPTGLVGRSVKDVIQTLSPLVRWYCNPGPEEPSNSGSLLVTKLVNNATGEEIRGGEVVEKLSITIVIYYSTPEAANGGN